LTRPLGQRFPEARQCQPEILPRPKIYRGTYFSCFPPKMFILILSFYRKRRSFCKPSIWNTDENGHNIIGRWIFIFFHSCLLSVRYLPIGSDDQNYWNYVFETGLVIGFGFRTVGMASF
jgi:hypothetical protein